VFVQVATSLFGGKENELGSQTNANEIYDNLRETLSDLH